MSTLMSRSHFSEEKLNKPKYLFGFSFLIFDLWFFFLLEQCDRDINVDIVSFMTGLLLGADPQVRSWISFYIRNGQKKHNESLAAFRAKLLDQLKNLIMEAKEYQQRDGAISQVFFFYFHYTQSVLVRNAAKSHYCCVLIFKVSLVIVS